ncbi:DUF1294 domain-containing protein [Pasteurellaceae bacterium LIM206]|nr:DUF1294 domain-containing protein [Pasteurellaceae bacterium LIM206]
MLYFFMSYAAAVNIAAYFLMGADKAKAKNKEWRVSEEVFFILCFIGGFIGIHLGMRYFRHKTQRLSFKLAVIVSAVLYVLVLPILLWWRLG